MKNKRNWQLYFSFIVTIFLFVTCGEPYAEILLTQEEFVRQLKAKFPGNFKDRDFPNTFYVGNASEPEDVQAYTIQALDSKKNSSLFKRNNACDLDNDGIKEFIFLHKYEDWQGAVSMFHKSGNKYLLTDFFPLPSAVQYKIFEQAEFIPFYDKYGFKLVTSDDYQDTDLVTGAFGMQSSKNIRIFEFRNNKLFEIFYHQISGGQVELLIKDLDGDGINEIKLNSLVFSYDKKNEKYQEKTGASEISSEKYKQALYKKYREASVLYRKGNAEQAVKILAPYFRNYDYAKMGSDIQGGRFTLILNDYAFFLSQSAKQKGMWIPDDDLSYDAEKSDPDIHQLVAEVIEVLLYVLKRDPDRMVAFLNLADAQYKLHYLNYMAAGFEKLGEWYRENYRAYYDMMVKANKEKRIPKRVLRRMKKTTDLKGN